MDEVCPKVVETTGDLQVGPSQVLPATGSPRVFEVAEHLQDDPDEVLPPLEEENWRRLFQGGGTDQKTLDALEADQETREAALALNWSKLSERKKNIDGSVVRQKLHVQESRIMLDAMTIELEQKYEKGMVKLLAYENRIRENESTLKLREEEIEKKVQFLEKNDWEFELEQTKDGLDLLVSWLRYRLECYQKFNNGMKEHHEIWRSRLDQMEEELMKEEARLR